MTENKAAISNFIQTNDSQREQERSNKPKRRRMIKLQAAQLTPSETISYEKPKHKLNRESQIEQLDNWYSEIGKEIQREILSEI